MKIHQLRESEKVLADVFPVYPGYCYIVDLKVVVSEVCGTVLLLKQSLDAKEVRQCDMFAHTDLEVGDAFDQPLPV